MSPPHGCTDLNWNSGMTTHFWCLVLPRNPTPLRGAVGGHLQQECVPEGQGGGGRRGAGRQQNPKLPLQNGKMVVLGEIGVVPETEQRGP
jgi:hypothetical protein